MTKHYSLIDSGSGRKLEQFGAVTLVRPSSLCIWQPRKSKQAWAGAQAEFVPKEGWHNPDNLNEWQIETSGVKLTLRLQDNGQIGFFPEHTLYLDRIVGALKIIQKPKVLNLFAYTGLASLVCLKAGADVTHVDTSKRALDWFKQNLSANNLDQAPARLIKEDAISFVEREIRRGNTYDLIIADPPSFSRLDGNKTWDLDDVMSQLVNGLCKLTSPKTGSIFFTSHSYELGGAAVSNLIRDAWTDAGKIESSLLQLTETDSSRELPAGILVVGSTKPKL